MANVDWFKNNGVSKAMRQTKEEDVVVEVEEIKVDYHKLKWNDLREYAKSVGVDLAINKSKDDILKALEVM